MNVVLSAVVMFSYLSIEATAVAPSSSATGEKLCFDTKEGQMAWPITDPHMVVHGFEHGPHCVDLLEEHSTTAPSSRFKQMHFEHCKATAIEMFTSLTKESAIYTISPVMCAHLLNKKKKQKRGLLSSYPCSFSYSFTYSCRIGKRSVQNENTVNSETPLQLFNQLRNATSNQMDLLYVIGGRNFGDILWKGYNDPSSFTTAEANYYNSLLSPHVVRLGALAFVCKNEASVEKAKQQLGDVIDSIAHVPTGVNVAF